MKMSRQNYRDTWLETMLRFLWREWTALGVSGSEAAPVRHVVDPEALLLFTCSLGRHDQRLFDEVIDWLVVNGRFISIQRLRNMLHREPFVGGGVLTAVADWLSRQSKPVKWKLLAQAGKPRRDRESLFLATGGGPLPELGACDPIFLAHGWLRNPVRPRGYAQAFPSASRACRFLKMRALFGVTVRCDVLVYLTLKRTGHSGEIARELYYSQKAVHETMTDLAASGMLHSVKEGRDRVFRLTSAGEALFGNGDEPDGWVNWAVLLSAVERVWHLAERHRDADMDAFLTSADIALTMKPLFEVLSRTSWAPALPLLEGRTGREQMDLFMEAFKTLAEAHPHSG